VGFFILCEGVHFIPAELADLVMAGDNSLVSVNLKTLRVALELVRHHQDHGRYRYSSRLKPYSGLTPPLQGAERKNHPGGARFICKAVRSLKFNHCSLSHQIKSLLTFVRADIELETATQYHARNRL
jgi:hypothetical protein